MRERPILFNSEMVRAILDGRKTMTRRVVKPQPTESHGLVYQGMALGKFGKISDAEIYCTFGVTGDRLWVREKFRLFNAVEECSHYESCDSMKYHNTPMYYADAIDNESKWKPSIHMPRSASRINLEITEVRVERLQDITVEDVVCEGISPAMRTKFGYSCEESEENFWIKEGRDTFRMLWDSLNLKRGYGWDANPWVWVIGFRRQP